MFNLSDKKLNGQSGFTLLEMTIALGIFVVLFTMTLGIYSSAIKAEQRTVQISKLQQEAQLIMELLAKKIRTSKVDYEFYTNEDVDNVNGENVLALRDKLDLPTVFRLNGSLIEVCSSDCGTQSVPNDINFNVIPATKIVVQDFTFFINPATNPFLNLSSGPTEFPRVTVVLRLENQPIPNQTVQSLRIQQTIPQRLAGP